LRLIDCQHHWWPRDYFELLLDRRQYPRTTRSGDGYTYWFTEDRGVPFPVEFVDLDVQRTQMRETGHEVTMVSGLGLGFDDLALDESKTAARVINTARARAQEEHPGELCGIAAIPWRDTAAALEEVEHAIATLGLRGITLPANLAGEGVDSPRLEEVYERVAELGVPLFIHPTASIVADRLTDYDSVLDYMLGWMLDTSVAAMRLVLSGILERHPTLKVVHHHAGAMIPYVIGRIDREVTDPWVSLPPLAELPSTYLRRMYVDCVVLNPPTVAMALEFYGEDHVLFGSDFPFWDVASSVAAVEAATESPEVRTKVFEHNAAGLLGINT
jgi:aminocarboxymuconate-semialdehyde decarboxylase